MHLGQKGDTNMEDKVRYGLFIIALFLLVINYFAMNNYINSNATRAEKYSLLIDAGEKCVDQVNKAPYGPLPLCEIQLKDILIKGNYNNIIIKGGLNETLGR